MSAILHIDGDAFFVSCEMAKDPSLKGKAVVTGRERGIASAMSYEAKRKGITRGMTVQEMKRICPEVIILPSDYETYSMYSKRMFEIVRRSALRVEEYSIDECFAEFENIHNADPVTPLREKITILKSIVQKELGITVSVGLSTTKVLAKVASKWQKPDGLTFIPSHQIPMFLKDVPVQKIWGIGESTALFLESEGIYNTLQFISKSKQWIEANLNKPFVELWLELRGVRVYEIKTPEKIDDQKSISKTRTFTPPSMNRERIFSELSKNIENACIKARRYNLSTDKFSVYLKEQNFRYTESNLFLSTRSSSPAFFISKTREVFSKLWKPSVLYRATGVVLYDLKTGDVRQTDFFGKWKLEKSQNKIFEAVDNLSKRFGKHTVFLASSLKAMRGQHVGHRSEPRERVMHLLPGESKRRHLDIPFLGNVR